MKVFFVYFLLACVLMRTRRFTVMSCMCPLINYMLATEENVKYKSAHDAITF